MYWRLKCHACGKRSEHSKGEVESFCCARCEAWTFVDQNGNYVDPPSQHVAKAPKHYAANSASFSQQSIFCSQCLRNQAIYNDLLGDYLPDEEDSRYDHFVARLPAYKKELEQRYPQICTACAPRAQSAIHEADYYSMTNNVSRALRRSASPVAVRRDDPQKLLMRTMLRLVGLLINVSALYQILWHAYAAMQAHQGFFKHGTAKASECMESLSRLDFTYPCVSNGASKIPILIILSTCLLWYNPGLIKLYDPQVRIASVAGSTQHLVINVVVLVIRALAVIKLMGGDLTKDQLIAGHFGTILLIVAGHIAAHKTIETEKWRVKGSIMPRPEDRDVLGQFAGPAQEKRTPQASRVGPAQLLRQSEPFPIQNLAPRRGVTLPPSPISEGDPMEIEPIPPSQQPSIPLAPRWDGMRTKLFNDVEEPVKPQRAPYDDDKHMYIKPFRGRLPAAPMSQERRLRNPMSQVQFKQPSTERKQDFQQQMRDAIERGRGYRRRSIDSDASEISTAAARTKGQLDLAQSTWELPGDGGSVLGIEDQLGGARLEDEIPLANVEQKQPSRLGPILAVVAAVILAFGFNVGGLRRDVCMYLVSVLQDLGY